jgi:hypothetical protein
MNGYALEVPSQCGQPSTVQRAFRDHVNIQLLQQPSSGGLTLQGQQIRYARKRTAPAFRSNITSQV